jgi:threonine dehydrogenase-like Zn-dependent dehydrogenase
VIIGTGSINLIVLIIAQLLSPFLIAVFNLNNSRLQFTKRLSAHYIIYTKENSSADILNIFTEDNRFDTIIKIIDMSEIFELCQELVTANDIIANIGIYNTKTDLYLKKLWNRNINESNTNYYYKKLFNCRIT